MSRITATSGILDRLEVKDIRIFKEETSLRWSGRLKHRNINLFNNGSTAKLKVFQSGSKAVIANDSYEIGVDTQAWSFDIQTGDDIQVGMAESSRDLSSLSENNDHVAKALTVSTGDKIVFLLSLTELKIEHNDDIYILDLIPFWGRQMYPWVSDTPSSGGFSIVISEYRFIDICIIDDAASISTKTSNGLSIPLAFDTGDKKLGLGNTSFEVTGVTTEAGQDFSMKSGVTGTGLTLVDSDGSIAIGELKVDSISHRSAGPMVFRGAPGGNTCQLDAAGAFTVDPGCVTATHIKAPDGSTIKLVNNAGTGMHITSGGSVVFDSPPRIDVIQSNPGTDLSLVEGSGLLGLTIKTATGVVSVNSGVLNTSEIDSATVLSIGNTTQTLLNVSRSGIDTEVDTASVAGDVDITGNITVTGTIDGVDLLVGTTGSVTAHSDVTDAGSGIVISAAERSQIATNAVNATGSLTVHNDITSAGSGIIISVAERNQIGINQTNASSVVAHSDITAAGSGSIITANERSQIGINAQNTTSSISIHDDITVASAADFDVMSYGTTAFENKTITGAGMASSTHIHVASNITDFNTETIARVTLQRDSTNGLCPLDAGGKIPAGNLDIDALRLCGVWDAEDNAPTLTSGIGDQGCVWLVAVRGSTLLDGISSWNVNDWAVFNGSTWDKISNTPVVTSVVGKTGAVTINATDLTDITDVGSGAIITAAERSQITANAAAITSSVTAHSDVIDVGSGAIITSGERAMIVSNTNSMLTVVSHSDITSAGSGAIISTAERLSITNGSTGTALSHSDISNAGSGEIITVAERNQIGTNTGNITGSVTAHSDISSAGSGEIITVAERNQIGTNAVNSSALVTQHSDVTSAGSGSIITAAERAAVVTNTNSIALKLPLTGGVMTGGIDMGGFDMNNVNIIGTNQVTVTGAGVRKIKAASGNDISLQTSGSNIQCKHEGGIDVDIGVTLTDTTESLDVTTGCLITDAMTTTKTLGVDGLLRLNHQIAQPPAPATDTGKLYVRNSILYYMGDNGVERSINLIV